MPIIYPRHRLFWLVLEIPFLDNEIVSNDGLLSGQTRSWLPYSGGWSALFFYGEFDPGSGRTLAACLTHASRTLKPELARVDEWRTGE